MSQAYMHLYLKNCDFLFLFFALGCLKPHDWGILQRSCCRWLHNNLPYNQREAWKATDLQIREKAVVAALRLLTCFFFFFQQNAWVKSCPRSHGTIVQAAELRHSAWLHMQPIKELTWGPAPCLPSRPHLPSAVATAEEIGWPGGDAGLSSHGQPLQPLSELLRQCSGPNPRSCQKFSLSCFVLSSLE